MRMTSISAVSVLFLLLITSTQATSTCPCARISPAPKNPGKCYYFVGNSKSRCRSRDCEPGFECTPGRSTGLTCMRRKVTKKITKVGPGKCIEENISGTQLVLYNSANNPGKPHSPPVPKPSSSPAPRPSPSAAPELKKPTNEPGEYVVVGGNKLVSRHTRLFDAMKELKKHKKGSRCIFEVKNKRVISDPHRIAGFRQSKKNGFNRSWDDWYDIRRMHRIAALWYADQHKSKPVTKGKFIVVVNDHVVRLYNRLKPAMKELRNHHKKVSRCIFEVKGHEVQRDPKIIRGQRQTQDNGFDKYWNDKNDIRRMYHIARVWYARKKLPGKYIAVANNKAKIFNRLYEAQDVLLRTKSGDRCIFEAKNGRVLKKVDEIAGIAQTPKNFFNVQLGGMKKLRRIALLKYAQRYIPVKNYDGPFIVITKNVAKKYGKLHKAMDALRNPAKFSRCIFEVKNGAVARNPRTIKGYAQKPSMGFDTYWSDKDIHRMYKIARKWWKDHNGKPKLKNKKGTFVVIVRNVFVGKYDKLFDAQRAIKKYKGKKRAIFEVENGKVRADAKKIAGYPQTKKYGFSKKWKNDAELNSMYKVATQSSKMYALVWGKKVEFMKKRKTARTKLQNIPKKSKKPRSVFKIEFGQISHEKTKGEFWKKKQRSGMWKKVRQAYKKKHEKEVKRL